MESLASTDVKIKMGENLINLVSQHPILYEKQWDYLNNQQPGDREDCKDGNAADTDSVMCWSQKKVLHIGPHARNVNDQIWSQGVLITNINDSLWTWCAKLSWEEKKRMWISHIATPLIRIALVETTFAQGSDAFHLVTLTSRRKSEITKRYLIREHLFLWIASNRFFVMFIRAPNSQITCSTLAVIWQATAPLSVCVWIQVNLSLNSAETLFLFFLSPSLLCNIQEAK